MGSPHPDTWEAISSRWLVTTHFSSGLVAQYYVMSLKSDNSIICYIILVFHEDISHRVVLRTSFLRAICAKLQILKMNILFEF